MKLTLFRTFILILFLRSAPFAMAQAPVIVSQKDVPVQVSKYAEIYVNKGNDAIADITTRPFTKNDKQVPIFLSKKNDVWLRLKIVNATSEPSLMISVQHTNIGKLTGYKSKAGQSHRLIETGNIFPYKQRQENFVDFSFDAQLPSKDSAIYYLHFESEHPLELPIAVNTYSSLKEVQADQSAIMGAYIGILGAILLYNLFVFFATGDRSYLVYVSYLLALALAQITYSGWGFRYLWPNAPQLNAFAVVLTSGLAGLAGVNFGISFLHIRRFAPWFYKVFIFYVIAYSIAIILGFTPIKHIGYALLNFTGILAGLSLLIVSARISRKGYRPARYYLLAWSLFLVGLIIFTLRNMGVLPVNTFINYTLYMGSAIEVIVLSIALADKINSLRKEKEKADAEALQAAEENRRLVLEQNIQLEQKVKERTNELETALTDLKDAQAQLVSAEKMASLGQLTAGIAHEINNPINFVKSNIKPLELDIKDLIEVIDEYETLHSTDNAQVPDKLKQIQQLKDQIDIKFVKQELNALIRGIEDGAERTAEIVKGLRTFSRLDESEIKTVNIHDGLDSTLVLLKNNTPHYLHIEKRYQANGEIECLPGKLNQVFMNVLNNAIQAITGKTEQTDKEAIVISTSDTDNGVAISIKDSGSGMPDDVKARIFEPFFTTKDVGEGTGLGLAIVYKIIEQHHGTIEVNSSIGEGTEFIIRLPRVLPDVDTIVP